MAKQFDRPSWAYKGTPVQCKESGKKAWGVDAKGVVSSIKRHLVFVKGDYSFRDGRVKERFTIDLLKGEGDYWELRPHTLPMAAPEHPSWLKLGARVRLKESKSVPLGTVSEGTVTEVTGDRFVVKGTQWRGGRTPRSEFTTSILLGPVGTLLDWEPLPTLVSPPKIIGLPEWIAMGVRVRLKPDAKKSVYPLGFTDEDGWQVTDISGNTVRIEGWHHGPEGTIESSSFRLDLDRLQEWELLPSSGRTPRQLPPVPREGVPFLVQDSEGSFHWKTIDERAIYLVQRDSRTNRIQSVTRVVAGSSAIQLANAQSALARRNCELQTMTGAEVRSLVHSLLTAIPFAG
jgi:hypothetical protein